MSPGAGAAAETAGDGAAPRAASVWPSRLRSPLRTWSSCPWTASRSVVRVPTYPIMKTIQEAWHSPNFQRLRQSHRDRTWDRAQGGEPICQSCAVTKKPTPMEIPKDGRVHLRVLTS